jgi:hypothetical protein
MPRALAEAGFSVNEGSVLTPAVSAAELFTPVATAG